MLEFVTWFWPIGTNLMEGIAIIVLFRQVLLLRRRHHALSAETTRMLGLHQNYAAAFDARLRTLGSRTTGDMPVPTADELVDGRWMR